MPRYLNHHWYEILLHAVLITVLTFIFFSIAQKLYRDNVVNVRQQVLQESTERLGGQLIQKTVDSKVMNAVELLGVVNDSIKNSVSGKLPKNAPQLIELLKVLVAEFKASNAFLMNADGVIVSYYTEEGESGIGKNLAYRPYFINAKSGHANIYAAVGINSEQRGLYHAAPIYKDRSHQSEVIGVIVIKMSFDQIDALVQILPNPVLLLTPEFVVLSSNNDHLLYKKSPKAEKFIQHEKFSKRYGNLIKKNQILPLPIDLDLQAKTAQYQGKSYHLESELLDWKDSWGNWQIILLEDFSVWFNNKIEILLMFVSFSVSLFLSYVIFLYIKSEKTHKKAKLLEKDLHYQQEYNELILDSAGEGIIGVTIEGNISFCNSAAYQMLGYSEDELINSNMHAKLHYAHADDSYYDPLKCPINAAFTDGKISHVENEVLWRKNGTHFPVDYKAFPIFYDNVITGAVVTFSDITERKKSHDLLLKQKNEIKEVNKHTRESIEYASLIQGALIPENNIFKTFFDDCFTLWEPKDIVGGDVYLAEKLRNDDEFLLMVIDCTGHGVPGAFVTMLVKAVERQIVVNILNSKKKVSPAKMLMTFNQMIRQILQQHKVDSISNAGFDGAVLYYNKKQNIVKFAGAETPLFVFQDNTLDMIKGDRHSVGYKKSNPNFEFTEQTIDVSIPTQIYLTTDGYLDQNGGDKSFPFGKKRFKKLLENNAHENFSVQKNNLLQELHAFQQEEERNDDITVIGLKF